MCLRVGTLILIGWRVERDAEILTWNSLFRLEMLCGHVLYQISGSLPFNSSFLALYAFFVMTSLMNEMSIIFMIFRDVHLGYQKALPRPGWCALASLGLCAGL